MEMTPVNSSAVSAVGYEGGTLRLRWKSNGRVSTHPGVSQQTYQALLAAPSIGKFIAEHVRKQHPAVEG